MVIDQSRFVQKGGEYAIANSGGISEPSLLGVATKYEEGLSRSFITLNQSDLEARFSAHQQVQWSEKYDGEGALLFFDEQLGAVAFSAPSGRARIGLKTLKQAEAALRKAGIKKGLFRGELYLPWTPGSQRAGIAGVSKASISNSTEDSDRLTLALFDIVALNGLDLRGNSGSYEEKWDMISKIFGVDPENLIHRARGGWTSGSELLGIVDGVLADGGEGVVVRLKKGDDLFKVKPHLSIDAVVIGYVEGAAAGSLGVRSILVGLSHPASPGGVVFQACGRFGSGIDAEVSADLFSRLSRLKIKSPLNLNDSEGREVHFVRPQLIVEVKGEDLVHQRQDGRLVRTQCFFWNQTDGCWSYVGLAPCPRLVFPSFVRLREDKSVESGGSRVEQILQNPQEPRQVGKQGAVQVIERRVYRKGADAVRKFILASRGGDDCLPYFVCFTDFSAGRKEPLKVSTDYAYNEKRAREILSVLLKENVKKGWEEHEG